MSTPDWDASQAASRAPKVRFSGRVWRAHWRQVDATDWTLSLNSSGRYHQGRDQFAGDQCWPALYTSLAPEVAVWEMVRRSAERNLAYLRENLLTELELDMSNVLDALDPSAIGLQLADLTGRDVERCRQLAFAALNQQNGGLLVPSAAMQGANLVLLPSNLTEPLPVRVISSRPLPIEHISWDHPR